MLVLDLTLPLDASTPVYRDARGYSDPEIRLATWVGIGDPVGDAGFRSPFLVTRIEMGLHVGTHVDAPAHFAAGGPTLDALPVEALVGSAVVVDLRLLAGNRPHPNPRPKGEEQATPTLTLSLWERESPPLSEGQGADLARQPLSLQERGSTEVATTFRAGEVPRMGEKGNRGLGPPLDQSEESAAESADSLRPIRAADLAPHRQTASGDGTTPLLLLTEDGRLAPDAVDELIAWRRPLLCVYGGIDGDDPDCPAAAALLRAGVCLAVDLAPTAAEVRDGDLLVVAPLPLRGVEAAPARVLALRAPRSVAP